MKYNWAPLIGKMNVKKESITFIGEKIKYDDQDVDVSAMGLFICDQKFSEGSISVDIKFNDVSKNACADIVLYYDPQNKYQLNAGLTSIQLFAIRHYDTKWTYHTMAGAPNSIEPNRIYHLQAFLRGSTINLKSDGVEVLRFNLPFPLPQSQVGLFCINQSDIEFSNFTIEKTNPKAFVIMQFSSPYNEVYLDVIKKICEEEKLMLSVLMKKTDLG